MSLHPLDARQLTGRSNTHVVRLAEPPCVLHQAVVQPFQALRAAAARAGIDLLPVSGFRDFQRQLQIWNAKARGERPLYDRHGEPIDYATLDPAARVDTILLWSALPGASRHHWGSDLDVVDAAVLAPGQAPPLLPQAYATGGLFAHLEAWLAANLRGSGFYRPYARDRGGVQPEPWHLSYAPVADRALHALTPQLLREALAASDIEDKEAVLARLPAIHERYVSNVEPSPAGGSLRDPTRLS
jgi:LAS superfamily LD-carboxypeptidase LdcB